MNRTRKLVLVFVLAAAVSTGCLLPGVGTVVPTELKSADLVSLTVKIEPLGSGMHNLKQDIFMPGEVVRLLVIPNDGYSFDHWSGDASGSTPGIGVLLDTDKTITAHFIQMPTTSPMVNTQVPEATPTATPSSGDTIGGSYYDPDIDMECIFWENVTPAMEGQHVCVFGKVTSTQIQYSGSYMYFNDGGQSFYLIALKEGDQYYYFPAVEQGVCVQADGIIKTYMNIPRIETKDQIKYWFSIEYYCDTDSKVTFENIYLPIIEI